MYGRRLHSLLTMSRNGSHSEPRRHRRAAAGALCTVQPATAGISAGLGLDATWRLASTGSPAAGSVRGGAPRAPSARVLERKIKLDGTIKDFPLELWHHDPDSWLVGRWVRMSRPRPSLPPWPRPPGLPPLARSRPPPHAPTLRSPFYTI